MTYELVSARLEFLDWRDEQFTEIAAQLEGAFPSLLDDLSLQCENASLSKVVTTSASVRKAAAKSVQTWSKAQAETALRRAKSAMENDFPELVQSVASNRNIRDDLGAAAAAISGVGLLGGSVAVIPAAVGWATVGVGGIAGFFGATTIVIPLMGVAALGVGVAAFVGSRTLDRSAAKARSSLRDRLHREAEALVFGIGQKPGSRCVLSDIQALVLKA